MPMRKDCPVWLRWTAFFILAGVLLPLPAYAKGPPAVAALPTSVTKPPAGNGVAQSATQLDLASLGYVEEEFLVTGKANVYEYDSAGNVIVKTPAVDYTTRILVRRPMDPTRFSGTVRVETMHPQYGIEFIWPRVTDYVLNSGDAEVSISMRRGKTSAIETMKKFDPDRYAPVNFTEDGLNWDIIGQVGRLLKTKTDLNPLNGYDVKRLTAQGWSGGGALLLIYISDGFHQQVRMPDGGPIFDAYLVGEPSGYPKINSSAPALSTDDPREKIRPIDVPVISLHTRPQESYRRRADGNEPGDRYRVYEVAGAAHSDLRLPPIYKRPAELPEQAGCTFEPSQFPMFDYFKSTLARLDAWAFQGVVPPPSRRITVNADGVPMLDAEGNPLGGVRSTYLDVPTARYFANEAASNGPASFACNYVGAQERFSHDKLVALYGDHQGYFNAVTHRLDELVKNGWILPADADELRKEAEQFGGI